MLGNCSKANTEVTVKLTRKESTGGNSRTKVVDWELSASGNVLHAAVKIYSCFDKGCPNKA